MTSSEHEILSVQQSRDSSASSDGSASEHEYFWIEHCSDSSSSDEDDSAIRVRRRNETFFRRYFTITANVRPEVAEIIMVDAWWFHDAVEPLPLTNVPYRLSRRLKCEFYEVPHDLPDLGDFEPPCGSLEVRFSLLDILLHKVGSHVQDPQTFNTWVFVCRQMKQGGVPIINAFTYFRKNIDNGGLGEDWRVSFWFPSLSGVGSVVLAVRIGYASIIHDLVSPDGVSFLHSSVMETPEFWLSEGPVLELCVRELRRLGATTMPFFEEVASRLSMLYGICIDRITRGHMSNGYDSYDQHLYELVRRTNPKSCIGKHLANWLSASWRNSLYRAALCQLGHAIATWREWHVTEAMYVRFLKKTFAPRFLVDASELIVCFLYGSCTCAICRCTCKQLPYKGRRSGCLKAWRWKNA